MIKVLTAETAQLSTALVSIKTITVSGKQVTLAVFRQLLEESMIDFDNLTLRGVPWGHVRYMVEDSHDEKINVVWQKGDELRRYIVSRSLYDWQHGDLGFIAARDICSSNDFSINSEIWECRGYRMTWKGAEDWDWKKCQEQRNIAKQGFVSQINERIASDNKRRRVLRERYKSLIDPLFDLPQLFIAV